MRFLYLITCISEDRDDSHFPPMCDVPQQHPLREFWKDDDFDYKSAFFKMCIAMRNNFVSFSMSSRCSYLHFRTWWFRCSSSILMKSGITFCDILDNISPDSLACREWKYPLLVYRIIFRTIFFTWPSDCIKKIAYLLCGSVLAWKLATQGPWNYKARIKERMIAINVYANYSVTHGSFWLCLIFRGVSKSQHVRRKWSYTM